MKSPRITKLKALRVFTLSAVLLLPVLGQAQATTNANPTLCVMTYNLRYASATPPNAWPQRRPLVREVITTVAPDLIGTQEGLLAQLQDLATDLPEFAWTGVGRDDGKIKGEFMAVFYRKARLEALATNHFWLSDTPELPGSTTWGNSNRRMVTWLKFRDRQTGGAFFLYNTHFDHQVQLAREKSATLLRQRVAALDTKLPLLLVGDFNADAGANQAYNILTNAGFFADVWNTARERHNEQVASFNDFKPGLRAGPRIDWILTRGAVAVERAETVTFSRDGQFPSDHFPVVTWLKLPPNR